jgi:putative heme iron utilization protein
MADSITPEVSDRICKHMNKDHADAIVLYARIFGKTPEVTSAQMLAIDPEGMNLKVQANGTDMPMRIAFDHTLVDAKDAHHTLVNMIEQTKEN